MNAATKWGAVALLLAGILFACQASHFPSLAPQLQKDLQQHHR